MKVKILFAITGLLIYSTTTGQDFHKYCKLVSEADQLYESKEYLKAGQKYFEAFKANGNKGISYDIYNAACSWALANEPDTAFKILLKFAGYGGFIYYDSLNAGSDMTYYNALISDPDFTSLHQDPRWNELLEIVRSCQEKAEVNINKELVAVLDTIYRTDQEDRMQIQALGEKYGWDSEELAAQTKVIDIKIRETDSVNLKKIEGILEKYGWPGPEVIGEQGSVTIWLVIQHSDLTTQEKYLPVMREAVKNGKASASNLAYLEDRVALRQGKRQIYGSQVGTDPDTKICYISPLEDPDSVDIRRADAGLPPIADYAAEYGFVWDVEQYKKDLPGIEAKEKANQK